jgi:hypothetical protein
VEVIYLNYNFKDLTGLRFGKLVVLNMEGHSKDGHITWRCKCDCGKEKVVMGKMLTIGKTQSCGCLRAENLRKIATTHGKSNTKLNSVWLSMRGRCLNSNNWAYHNYGGRGIKVCEEWNNFAAFYKWAIENGYKDKLTIDRINNNGNYEPSNCRWATAKEQANNKRTNHYVEYHGERKTMSQLSDEHNINYSNTKNRINVFKWDIEKAVSTPPNTEKRRFLTCNGKTQTISQWARETGISRSAIECRIDKSKWSVEKALTTPLCATYYRYLTYKGETQPMKYWCKKFNISRHALDHRINALKWPTEKALTKPTRKTKRSA